MGLWRRMLAREARVLGVVVAGLAGSLAAMHGQVAEESPDKVDIEQAVTMIVDYLQAADTAGNRNGYVTRAEVSARSVATGKRAGVFPLAARLIPPSGEFNVERIETELRQEMSTHDADTNGRLTTPEFYHAVDTTRGIAERANIRSAAENRLMPIVNLEEVIQDYRSALMHYGFFNKQWRITTDQFADTYCDGNRNQLHRFQVDPSAEVGLISRRVVYLSRNLSGQQKEDLYQVIPERGVYTTAHLQLLLSEVIRGEVARKEKLFAGAAAAQVEVLKVTPVKLDELLQVIQERLAQTRYLKDESEFAGDERFSGVDARGLLIADIIKEFEALLTRSTMSKREQKAFAESGIHPENINVINWERLVDATQAFGNKFYDLGYGAKTEAEFLERYPAGIDVLKEVVRMRQLLFDSDSPDAPAEKDGRLSLAELRRIKLPGAPAPAPAGAVKPGTTTLESRESVSR